MRRKDKKIAMKKANILFEQRCDEGDNDYDPEYGLYNSRDNEGENDNPWADEDAQIKADQDRLSKKNKVKEAGPEQDWTSYQDKQGQEDSTNHQPNEKEVLFGKFRQKIESLRNVANEANNMNASIEDVAFELSVVNDMFAKYKEELKISDDLYQSSQYDGERHGY